MSKPYQHAVSSAAKFSGTPDDYLEIHQWFDQTKAHFGSNVHRAILHSSFGIFLAEAFFGVNITNSEGKLVSVRDIGEQHLIEDLGFIPTVSDYLENLQYQPWMSKEAGAEPPSSQKKLGKKKKEPKVTEIPFEEVYDKKPEPQPEKRPLMPWPPLPEPHPWTDKFPWEDPRKID